MFILWFRKARSSRRVFEDLIYELVEIQNTFKIQFKIHRSFSCDAPVRTF